MRVSAVVISHGHADELEHSLPALAPQVDELLLIANIPGSVPRDLPEASACWRTSARSSFAANANVGAAQTTEHELVLIVNPDAIPDATPSAILRTFMEEHPRCGVAGPKMLYSDGSGRLAPRLSDGRRHARAPHAAAAAVPAAAVAAAPLPPRRAARRAGAGGHDAGCVPAHAPGDARRDRRLGPGLQDVLRGHRPQLSCRRAGWERWYVPAAVVRHEYAAVIDKRFLTRHTLWHARAMLRFLRKHPERLLALR